MDLDNVFLVNATEGFWLGYTTLFVLQQEGQEDWRYEYSDFIRIAEARKATVSGGSPNPSLQRTLPGHSPGQRR
jgi:hypothetical protein